MSVEKKNTSKTPNVQSVEAEVEKGVVKKIATNKKLSAKKKTVKPVTRKSVKVNIPQKTKSKLKKSPVKKVFAKKTKKRTVNKIPSTVIKKNINEPIVKKAKEEIKIEKEPKKELIPEIKTDEPLITMEKIEGIKADREKVLAEEKKNKKEELVLRGDEMKSILAPRSQKQEMLTEKKEKENIEKIEEAIIDNLGGGRSVGMYRKIALSFFFQAEDGIRDWSVTGVQTCALFFSSRRRHTRLVSDWSSDVCSSDLRAHVFFPSRRRHTRLVSDWSSDVCSSDLRAHVCSQAEDGIRDWSVTGVQTCALPI